MNERRSLLSTHSQSNWTRLYQYTCFVHDLLRDWAETRLMDEFGIKLESLSAFHWVTPSDSLSSSFLERILLNLWIDFPTFVKEVTTGGNVGFSIMFTISWCTKTGEEDTARSFSTNYRIKKTSIVMLRYCTEPY